MAFTGVPVREALDSAQVALRAAGVDTPRLDAEVLLAHALGVDRARLIIDRDLTVEGPAIRRFQDAVRRRAVGREPVAYITGRRAFRHLELAVDPRVLIPRPGTELLVELALPALPEGAQGLDGGPGGGRRGDGKRGGGARAGRRAPRPAGDGRGRERRRAGRRAGQRRAARARGRLGAGRRRAGRRLGRRGRQPALCRRGRGAGAGDRAPRAAWRAAR